VLFVALSFAYSTNAKTIAHSQYNEQISRHDQKLAISIEGRDTANIRWHCIKSKPMLSAHRYITSAGRAVVLKSVMTLCPSYIKTSRHAEAPTARRFAPFERIFFFEVESQKIKIVDRLQRFAPKRKNQVTAVFSQARTDSTSSKPIQLKFFNTFQFY
jgi:hypothetical protein